MPPVWPNPSAPKPGVVPLRPLSIPEMLEGAVQSIRFNPRLMLGLSAVVALVFSVLGVILSVVGVGAVSSDVQPGTLTAEEAMRLLRGMLGAALAVGLVTYLAQLIATGVLAAAVSRAVLGQRLSVAEAWALTQPRLWSLIGTSLLAVLAATLVMAVGLLLAIPLPPLGLLLAVVGVLWLTISFALFAPVVVLEGQDPVAGLERSARLVRGSWWRTFGVLVLAGLVSVVVSSVLRAPFSLIASRVNADPTSLPAAVVAEIGSFLGSTLTLPFLSAVLVLVYIDRRIRREALDVELMRAAGLPTPTEPGPGGGAGHGDQ